jgi:nitroimidazol reductase NimA-like FMN-containing flavoprotein (pyridoxamine 5'-phosphate oxidase superfamily)
MSTLPTTFPVTDRTRVRRLPDRASHLGADVLAVLDVGLVCHVGLVDDGRPVVIPTLYARQGDRLVLHGSRASRTMRAAAAGAELCITVTLIDGLVLARSAFHHSVNYRSAIVYGRGAALEDDADKTAALRALVEHVVPGRWDVARPPTAQELKATTVIAAPIDDAADLGLPVWAGVLPLAVTPGAPEPAERCAPGTAPPRRHWPLQTR